MTLLLLDFPYKKLILVCPVRMVFDDELEEIFDDPIKINFGSGGIMNGLLRGTEIFDLDCVAEEADVDIIDLTGSRSYRNLPVLEDKCDIKPLNVKLVDCFKYPWYYRKNLSEILRNLNKSKKNIEKDTREKKTSKVVLSSEMEKREITKAKRNDGKYLKGTDKEKEYFRRKLDIEIRRAVSQRNKTEVDFKRNKGLIGMVVTEKKINIDKTEGLNKPIPEKIKIDNKHKNKPNDKESETFIQNVKSNQSKPEDMSSSIQSKSNSPSELGLLRDLDNKQDNRKDSTKSKVIQKKLKDSKKYREVHKCMKPDKRREKSEERVKTHCSNKEIYFKLRYFQDGKMITKIVKCIEDSKNDCMDNYDIATQTKRKKLATVQEKSTNMKITEPINDEAVRPQSAAHNIDMNVTNRSPLNETNTVKLGENDKMNKPTNLSTNPSTSLQSSLNIYENNLKRVREDIEKQINKTLSEKPQFEPKASYNNTPKDLSNQPSKNLLAAVAADCAMMNSANNSVSENILNHISRNQKQSNQLLSQDQARQSSFHVVAYNAGTTANHQNIYINRNHSMPASSNDLHHNVNSPYLPRIHNNYSLINQGHTQANLSKYYHNQVPSVSRPQGNSNNQNILSAPQNNNEHNRFIPPIYTNAIRPEVSSNHYRPAYSQNIPQTFHQSVMQGFPRQYYPNYYRQRSYYDGGLCNGKNNPARSTDINQNRSWPGSNGTRVPYSECSSLPPLPIPPPPYTLPNQHLSTPDSMLSTQDTSIIGRNDEGLIKKINIRTGPLSNILEKNKKNPLCENRESESSLSAQKQYQVHSIEKEKDPKDELGHALFSEKSVAAKNAVQKELDDLITNLFEPDTSSITFTANVESNKAEMNNPMSKPCPLSKKLKDQAVVTSHKTNEENRNNSKVLNASPNGESSKEAVETINNSPFLNKSVLKSRLLEENEILIDRKISKKRFLFEKNVTDKEGTKKISIEEYKNRSLGSRNGQSKSSIKSNENRSVK
uniref:Uncharacterized protein n=3 Tax=Bombyx mori TaxID=7091 RepID=A0A8R2DLJ3_BOMMO|nr:putative uncharacterized protein DDB_G0282133 isoform X1 [Bombyx mori]